MIYIAHRGLFRGADKEKENHPDQIKLAWAAGYECEVDVRRIDGQWVLGHDKPQYEVSTEFLTQGDLWIHAKNLEALHWLTTKCPGLNFFWHQEDDFTLTSNGYIWTYPGKPLTDDSIMVMPETADSTLENTRNVNCYGICSDYVERIKLDFTK